MSIEFAIFSGAVVLLIAYRNLGSGAISGAGGSIASGIKGTLAWIGGAGKSAGSAVGSRVVMGLLWIAVLVSMKALFPDAFAAWWNHQNIFWVSQLVAVLVILFFSVKYTQWAFGAAIAVMLYAALGSTFWPEKERSKEVAEVITFPIIKTVTVYPGKWETVQVPQNHTFFYECDGWGLVKVLGNRINPKECGPRAAKPNDWFGDNLRTTGGNLYLSFTSTTSKPIKAVVKIWPNSSL